MKLSNRIGKIVLEADFMDKVPHEELSVLFSFFFPVSIDYCFQGHLSYVGCSPLFPKLEQGEDIPEYQVEIVIGKENESVNFIRLALDGE